MDVLSLLHTVGGEPSSERDKAVKLGLEEHEQRSEQGATEYLKEGFPGIDGTVLRVIEHRLVMEIIAHADTGKTCKMEANGDYCEHI